MNKALAFAALLAALCALTLFDPRFAVGALSMTLGAVAITVFEWIVEIWRGK